jgi:fructokinase
MTDPNTPRIGIDLGGTKIAGIVLGQGGAILAETRRPTPREDYDATIAAIGKIAVSLEQLAGVAPKTLSVGIGMPGSISPKSGLVQNSNSTWLNAKPFHADLEKALGRPLRLSNDANCFALSEAVDGAATGARSVFGVIMGTGCGGALVVDGKILEGPHRIAGEWGHVPLPWMTAHEFPGPRCWCGRDGCIETFISGSGLARDHADVTGVAMTGEEIVAAATKGETAALATLDRHVGRAARALAMIANVFDPEVIVLGGGLSQLSHLYDSLPSLMARYMFSDHACPVIRPPRWGDASGVRGAARLW